jgi:uncharacterized protein YqgC (DUF456 family)
MTGVDLLVGLAIAVGLVGVVVPVLPGLLLVLGAILVWALTRQDEVGWVVFAVAALLFVLGQVAKYVLPGRRLREAGIPTSTMVVGALLAVVGFFVVPVIGLVIGFVVGVLLAEIARTGALGTAWTSTVHAIKAAGWSMLIELGAGLLMAAAWVAGLLA